MITDLLPHRSKALDQGFAAWEEDMNLHANGNDLPQATIIPLIAVWHSVVTNEAPESRFVRNFAVDVLASEIAVNAFMRGIEENTTTAMFFKMNEKIPIPRYGLSAQMFDNAATASGRPKTDTHIPTRELAIIGCVAHAAYNSTSGNRCISLDPFGPHPGEPNAWKVLGFENSIGFVSAQTVPMLW